MDLKPSSFRLIFAISEMLYQANPGTQFRMTVCGTTKSAQLPLREALVMDLNDLYPNATIEFTFEDENGHALGFGDYKIPPLVHQQQETQLNEVIKIRLDDSNEAVTVRVYLVFLNKGLFREKAKAKTVKENVVPQSTSPLHQHNSGSKNNTSMNNSRAGSTTPSSVSRNKVQRSATSKPTSPKKATPSSSPMRRSGSKPKNVLREENEFNQYLNKVVDKHADEIEKINAESQKQTQEDISPFEKAMLHARNDSVSEQNTYIDLSPDKLKTSGNNTSFEDMARVSSPARRRQLVDLVTGIEKNVANNSYQKAQIDSLKNVILALDTKVKQMKIVKAENELLKQEQEKTEQARKDLQQSIFETTNELKQENTLVNKQNSDLRKEKDGLIQKNDELMTKVNEQNQAIAQLKSDLDRKENQFKELEYETIQKKDMEKHINKVENMLQIVQSKREGDQRNFQQILDNLQKSLGETRRIIDEIGEEKNELQLANERLRLDLAKEKSDHQETQRILALWQKKYEAAEAQKETIRMLQEDKEDLKRQVNETQEYHSDLSTQVNNLREELQSKDREFETIEKKYLREICNLKEKLDQSDTRENVLVQEVSSQKSKITELKSNVSSLEQILCIKEDVNRQLDQVSTRLAAAIRDREALGNHVDSLIQSQNIAQNKVVESEKTILDLKHQITDRDEYILNLKKVIIDIKEKQPLYIPKKDDYIDTTLADFINSSPNPGQLRALFFRESEGVYIFGTRKVYLKVENDRPYVRVGGGYVTIQEFLEQSLTQELEKILKSDQLKQLDRSYVDPKGDGTPSRKNMSRTKTFSSSSKDASPRPRK